MSVEQIKYIQVWSGWSRLCHWLLAFGVLFQFVSAWLVTNAVTAPLFWYDWHLMVGQSLILVLLLRIGLLFVPGSGHWRQLTPRRSQLEGIRQMLKFYLSLGRFPLPNWYAFNPFWQPVYLLVWLVLAACLLAGLDAGVWHARFAQWVLVFSIAHVVAVMLHDWKGRGATISALFSGYRYFHVSPLHPAPEAAERKPSASVSIDSISVQSKEN